jgi:hypothetical protein
MIIIRTSPASHSYMFPGNISEVSKEGMQEVNSFIQAALATPFSTHSTHLFIHSGNKILPC